MNATHALRTASNTLLPTRRHGRALPNIDTRRAVASARRLGRRWDDRPGVERFATPSDIALRSVTSHVPHR